MTREHGPQRQLSAEEERSVTRALSELPPPPVPPALAARLDARLTELEAERAQGTPVVPLPTLGATVPATPHTGPGSRRRWPRALLAAAAVLAGGYAVGTALHGVSSGGSTSSAGSAASSSDSSSGGPAGPTSPSATDHGNDPGGTEHAPRRALAPGLGVHAATLGADVRRMLRTGPTATTDGTTAGGTSARGSVRGPAGCRLPSAGPPGTLWLVRYDGARSLMVTESLPGDRMRVTVYVCGASAPAVRTTVRAP